MLFHILLCYEEGFGVGEMLEEPTGSLLVIINCISYELNKWTVGGGLTAPTSFISV